MVPSKNDRKADKHVCERSVPRAAYRPATDMYAKFSAGLHDPRHVVAFQLLFYGGLRVGDETTSRAATLRTAGKQGS
ncbi:hypothetical protein [Afipia sp. GAS231]|uniref:hypothetical protein n=1 Tax=Afipia sp. GAS231 TaxID=1882747 RepID=UPI00087A3B3B|nr:hypothetical protein [Afipia sp. GAS231]SDO48424.1 hypothetical protein SAMN05444050_4249 [Afipia sp. GAS231]